MLLLLYLAVERPPDHHLFLDHLVGAGLLLVPSKDQVPRVRKLLWPSPDVVELQLDFQRVGEALDLPPVHHQAPRSAHTRGCPLVIRTHPLP